MAFILYKLFLGILLPIAIFISLGYVLKVLLKGEVNNLSKETLPINLKAPDSSLIENVVEIQTVNEDKSHKNEGSN